MCESCKTNISKSCDNDGYTSDTNKIDECEKAKHLRIYEKKGADFKKYGKDPDWEWKGEPAPFQPNWRVNKSSSNGVFSDKETSACTAEDSSDKSVKIRVPLRPTLRPTFEASKRLQSETRRW